MRLGGFEPPSFGLEVDANGLAVPRGGWPGRTVERSRLGRTRAPWQTLVDPALTPTVHGQRASIAGRLCPTVSRAGLFSRCRPGIGGCLRGLPAISCGIYAGRAPSSPKGIEGGSSVPVWRSSMTRPRRASISTRFFLVRAVWLSSPAPKSDGPPTAVTHGWRMKYRCRSLK